MPGRRGLQYIPIGNQKIVEIGGGLTLTSVYGAGYRGAGTETFLLSAAGASIPVLYGSLAPVTAGAGVGQVYHQTSTGTSAGVLMNTWTWDGTVWFNESQPINVTRAQLIALRNASQLRQSQHYLITDHVQGRLVTGTTILVHATADNEISESVTVNTTYDNEGWSGIYDLDRGLVLELHDNRNNVARGANGTEVSNFDWGNANITNTTVDSATWTHTIGSPRIVSDLTVKSLATLTTTGWAGGSITGGTVIRGFGTNVNMTNANVSLLIGEIKDASILNLSGFTAGSTLNRYNLASSNFNFSNSTSAVSLSIVTAVGSTFNHSGVTTGTVTGTNLTMSDTSVISHQNGAGNLSLNRVDLINWGNITHIAGTVALADYKVSGGASVQQTGAGNTSLSNGELSGQSSVINQSTVTVNGTRYSAAANSSFNANPASAGTVTLTGTSLDNSSQISKTAGSTAGNMVITTSTLTNSTIIQHTGIGNLTITDTEFSSNSRVTLSSTRNLTITRGKFASLSQILQSGTGAFTDSIVDSESGTRGVYNLSSTGAGGNLINYGRVEGLGGNFNISGTSMSQVFNRVKADAATYNFTNNTVANTYSNMSITDGCTATFQNMAVTKNFNNVQLDNGSFLNVNAPTGVGTIQGIAARDSATININGTARAGNGIYAKERGTVTFNGGNCTDITKEMNGVLTTGAFTHNNVMMINPISQTLTANNTNRSSYLGVVSSVPLI